MGLVRLFVIIVGGKGNEKTEKHGKLGGNLYFCSQIPNFEHHDKVSYRLAEFLRAS